MTEEIERTPENQIVWRNAQWVIFGDGFLSARWCEYHIAPPALRGVGRPWHEHLSEKTWLDMDQFCQAFREAVKRNGAKIGDDEITTWETEAREYLEDARERYPQDAYVPRYDEHDDAYYGHWA